MAYEDDDEQIQQPTPQRRYRPPRLPGEDSGMPYDDPDEIPEMRAPLPSLPSGEARPAMQPPTPPDMSAAPSPMRQPQPQPRMAAPPVPEPPARPKSNTAQNIARAFLSATRLAPAADEIVHPKYSEQMRGYQSQLQRSMAQAQIERESAQTQMYRQHGDYWENRSQQERNRFKFDPKTGNVLDTSSGKLMPPQQTYASDLQSKMAALKAAGFSDGEARIVATGGHIASTENPNMLEVDPSIAQGVLRPDKDGKFYIPASAAASVLNAQNKPTPTLQIPPEERAALIEGGVKDVNNPTPQEMAAARKRVQDDRMRVAIGSRQPKDTSGADMARLDREINQYGKKHQTAFETATAQLEKIDEANSMLNSGAVGQALELPKLLTAVVSGAGTGVRITQPEIDRILHARGIVGNMQAWLSRVSGKGDLAPQQKQEIAGVLADVRQRIAQKQKVANDTIDSIQNARTRDEIIRADGAARQAYSGMGKQGGKKEDLSKISTEDLFRRLSGNQ